MDVTVSDTKTPNGMAAEAYIARLGERGIEYVFANAGTDFAPIVEALSRTKGAKTPRFMTVPHENVAMAMAHGYYRIAGKPAAVMVHVTVGTASAINGLINAARDNIPVLLAAGRTPLTETGSIASRNRPIHWGQEAFDQGGMLREYVKWDYELRAGQPVEAVVDRALDIAMSEPRGPVYLTLPREVLAAHATKPRRDTVRPLGAVAPEPARARGGGRAGGTSRTIRVAGGAGRGARYEPADRSSHAPRPRRRRILAEGRRGDCDRQRRAVDAAQPPAAQGRQGHPHFRRPARDPLSVPRDRSGPLGHGLFARGHGHVARNPRRGDEREKDRDREPPQGAGRGAGRDRCQAPQADRDREGSDPDPSRLARRLHQPGEIGRRHRHQRTRRSASRSQTHQAAELYGRIAVGRARLRAGRRARRQACRPRARGDRHRR